MEHYRRDCLFIVRRGNSYFRAGVWFLGADDYFVGVICGIIFCVFCRRETQIVQQKIKNMV